MGAAAIMEFAVLEQKAELVDKARARPTLFEATAEIVTMLVDLARMWDRLTEPQRNLLRHFAHRFSQPSSKTPFVARWRAAWEIGRMSRTHGLDETMRQVARFQHRLNEFVCVVMEEEERANPDLHSKLEAAVRAGLDSSSRQALSKDKVDEWFARLPS